MSAGQIIVALATESAIKKDATVMAFGSACPSYGVKLQCFATPSHINEQPEGFQETMRGFISFSRDESDLFQELQTALIA